jgi:Protein of unknown function (DUF1687)
MLQAALSGPYPPGRSSTAPLKFNLEVVENSPPTADQVKTILSYLPSMHSTDNVSDRNHIAALLSSHPSAPSLSDRPHSAETFVRLAQKNLNTVRWPIVVDWTGGRAAIGDVDGVKGILENLRRQRDGETKEDKPASGWFS